MNGGSINPDVVVLGMPSCGKTVFFTVLGKKFTSLVDGRNAAPLGFRMSTCDWATAKVVGEAYDRLASGKWPEATKAGQIMPLRWEVSTGLRRVFELFSMDIAGETFKKAFDIEDAMVSPDEKKTENLVKTKRKKADDDDIYLGETSSGDDEEQKTLSTEEEQAVQKLKGAIAAAKVVCFMVNIALPDRRVQKELTKADETKLRRFRSSVMNIYLSLKEQADLRAKSVIVLTQAHLHGGEIERAGGPVMYLADICGGEAAELSNLAKVKGVPVLAVSAINEEGRSNELPEINSPSDIQSSGLFGFLLTVAGMVAGKDGLAKVKNAYLNYQRNRVDYLKMPTREICMRLRLARQYKAAADTYVDACDNYLDDIENLQGEDDSSQLPLDAQRTYKQFTRADPEVREACEREYLVRDELWDRALRMAVVAEKRGAGVSSPRAIADEVWKGLSLEFPEKCRSQASEVFVYGFSEDELLVGSEAPTFARWTELNLREYRKELEEAISSVEGCKDAADASVAVLKKHVGKHDFETFKRAADKSCDVFEREVADFCAAWFCNGDAPLPQIGAVKNDVDKMRSLIDECVKAHEIEIATQLKSQRKREANRRLRKTAMVLVLLLALCSFAMFLARVYCDKRNLAVVHDVERAVSQSDYARAQRLCDTLLSIEWLGVRKDDHTGASFRERLALASDVHAARRTADVQWEALESGRGWLDGIESPTDDISRVREMYEQAAKVHAALPPSVSFADITHENVNLQSKLDALKKGADLFKRTSEEVGKARKAWDDHVLSEKITHESKRTRSLAESIGREVGRLDEKVIAERIAQVDKRRSELLELAKELSVTNDVFEEDIDRLEKTADTLRQSLEKRQEEMAREKFGRFCAEVRAAIASNSVSAAWEKFGKLSDPTAGYSNEEEVDLIRGELVKLSARECEKTVAQVEKQVFEEGLTSNVLAQTRKSLESLEAVEQELRNHISDREPSRLEIENRVRTVKGRLPVIVQIDGVSAVDGQPVDIEPATNPGTAWIMGGESPETHKKCLYLRMMSDGYPPGSSRLIRIASGGKTNGMSIRPSDFRPGITRLFKEIAVRLY